MSEDLFIKRDRLQYTKNTASSRLAILAILFDVLFFVSVYKTDVGTWYYTIQIGASILYNLIFMLLAFLASEGVKRYKPAYSWLLIALGVIQAARIFILPLSAHQAEIELQGQTVKAMGDAQFVRCIIYLAVSAACCLASSAINFRKCGMLKAHLAAGGSQAA